MAKTRVKQQNHLLRPFFPGKFLLPEELMLPSGWTGSWLGRKLCWTRRECTARLLPVFGNRWSQCPVQCPNMDTYPKHHSVLRCLWKRRLVVLEQTVVQAWRDLCLITPPPLTCHRHEKCHLCTNVQPPPPYVSAPWHSAWWIAIAKCLVFVAKSVVHFLFGLKSCLWSITWTQTQDTLWNFCSAQNVVTDHSHRTRQQV